MTNEIGYRINIKPQPQHGVDQFTPSSWSQALFQCLAPDDLVYGEIDRGVSQGLPKRPSRAVRPGLASDIEGISIHGVGLKGAGSVEPFQIKSVSNR